MVSSTIQTESTDEGICCGSCQHSVDVRGMEQIVCLTHLAVFHPAREGDCGEFEGKRKSTLSGD